VVDVVQAAGLNADEDLAGTRRRRLSVVAADVLRRALPGGSGHGLLSLGMARCHYTI
jgi:hypothetical protein